MIKKDGKPHNLLGNNKSDVDIFFLGGRKISFWKVAHLLTSSSFGINAIFYATWLGYLMGMWGMILQAVWCLSFLLFSHFLTLSPSQRSFTSHFPASIISRFSVINSFNAFKISG